MSKQSDLVSVSQGADGDPLYVDSTNNRVGIGTSSPSGTLTVEGNIRATHSSGDRINLNHDGVNGSLTNVGGDFLLYANGAQAMIAHTNGTERMRIDSSGRLLVGKTTNSNSTAGTTLYDNGKIEGVRDGGPVHQMNRLTSDGNILVFQKDGSTVGNIGVDNSRLFICSDNGSSGSGIKFTSSDIRPTSEDGAEVDNTKDVGDAAARFDDIYATNGTIQTSDQNEKQQIASLTDAEMTAAKAISKLFKTFKWNDSVAEKGDAARTHSGVIAQEVEQAMTDAGLNAGDYAFFISTTWWETQTEVPAVEAVDEVLDEDGNVITEAVEGKEAYTRTDTYNTAEEAPEGATERNRKGIRYPQLLSFIGAATEQRLASIETRLDALETN